MQIKLIIPNIDFGYFRWWFQEDKNFWGQYHMKKHELIYHSIMCYKIKDISCWPLLNVDVWKSVRCLSTVIPLNSNELLTSKSRLRCGSRRTKIDFAVLWAIVLLLKLEEIVVRVRNRIGRKLCMFLTPNRVVTY